MDGLPIGGFALLSDCRCAALVSRAGSVDWLCFPRFHSPAAQARQRAALMVTARTDHRS